jgi:hypothetical protein
MADREPVTSEIWGHVPGTGMMHNIGVITYEGDLPLTFEGFEDEMRDFVHQMNEALNLVRKDEE